MTGRSSGTMGKVDLDTVADELYSASPDEFVERRKARVAEARSAKDRELVKAITQLRRPTRSAWLVNLLARESPADVSELLELGSALADAQQRASGPDLRRLSKQRHAALETLTRRAAELGAAHGHSATEATRQEVSQTLQAALADPAVAELLRAGRVVQAAAYGGFGPMDLFGAGLVPAPAGQTSTPDSDVEESGAEKSAADAGPGEPEAPAPEPEDPARRRAEAAVTAADEALATAREEAAAADREAEQATTQSDELADQVEALRSQLEQAEEEERRARERARSARKAAQQSQQALASAEQALADARAALADLGDGDG